jgi:hypothetical protein
VEETGSSETSVITHKSSRYHNPEERNLDFIITSLWFSSMVKKGQGCPCRLQEGVWGNGVIAPHILNHSTRWRWVVKFTPQLFYPPGKERSTPIQWEAGWTPKMLRKFWGRDVSRTTAGIRTPVLPARSVVSSPTTVTRLLPHYGFLILVFEGLVYEADGLGIEVRFPAKAIYFYLLWRRDRFW